MKKIFLFMVLTGFMFSCSSDDDNDNLPNSGNFPEFEVHFTINIHTQDTHLMTPNNYERYGVKRIGTDKLPSEGIIVYHAENSNKAYDFKAYARLCPVHTKTKEDYSPIDFTYVLGERLFRCEKCKSEYDYKTGLATFGEAKDHNLRMKEYRVEHQILGTYIIVNP